MAEPATVPYFNALPVQWLKRGKSEAHQVLHMISHLHGWWPVVGSGALSTSLFAASESTGLLDGAPSWVRLLVWAGIVISTLAGAILAVKKIVKDSDAKTAQVGEEVKASVVEALKDDLQKFQLEQRNFTDEQRRRNEAVSTLGPSLVDIRSNLRDIGDVRGEMLGVASHVGELDHRINKVEHDLDELHNWKRKHLKDHEASDLLLKKWALEYKQRHVGSEEKTPPTGWNPGKDPG